MRNLALIFLLLLTSIFSNAQEFFYENNFDGNTTDSLLRMGQEENNIWQIGVSSKSIFSGIDSVLRVVGGFAYDIIIPPSIMTDTANSYPTNNVSSFEIEFGHDYFDSYHAMRFAIIFSHKYQTDKGRDGGVLELSYDGGLNWENILKSSYPAYAHWNAIYTINDTLVDGTPAFTGESENWVWSEVQWLWDPTSHPWADNDIIDLRVRFLFKSDSIENNMAGWSIDNIQLWYYSMVTIKNNEFQIASKVFPNPVYSESILRFDNSIRDPLIVKIYNLQGSIIKSAVSNENQIPINKSEFESGLYLYRISTKDGSSVGSGKFIVN